MINQLSEHLFWDIDKSKLDMEKNKPLIIKRVLDYGLLNDWNQINQYYGLNQISQTAITIKDLDPKSLSFISLLSNIPKEEFLCYTTQLSNPKHWNF